jgi:benzoate-CoA ligase family protein
VTAETGGKVAEPIREVPERFNIASLLDDNIAAGRGEKVAIHCELEEVTYADLVERSQRCATLLRSLGVGPENRVLMVLDDTPHWPAVFVGALRMGAVPVPVSFLDSAANFAHYLRDSYAEAVIVEAGAWPAMEEALQDVGRPITALVANGEVPGVRALEQELRAAEPTDGIRDTHRDDMAFWLYSSGSTGKPKAAVHLHHDIAFTLETYARNVLDIQEEDVTFSTTKLYHAYGLGNGFSFPYSVGATTILSPGKPNPEKLLTTATKHQPTLFFSVPTLYNAMLAVDDQDRFNLAATRACLSAAEPLPPEILRGWRERFGVDILDGIGSTEMLHIYCSNRLGHVYPGTSGEAVPGYELSLRDDEGQDVERGEVGNLYVRGDSALAFYWHQHERTKRCVQGSWYYSGDRYRQDEGGNFIYEGRADDMIKVGGLWVSPIEIENALIEHPSVFEAAAVGVPEGPTIRIKAFVVLAASVDDPEALEGELQAWCKDHLRRYEYPHFFEFTESLPKTQTGKIQRYKLRSA